MPRRLKPPWTAVRTYPPNSEEEVRQRPFPATPAGVARGVTAPLHSLHLVLGGQNLGVR